MGAKSFTAQARRMVWWSWGGGGKGRGQCQQHVPSEGRGLCGVGLCGVVGALWEGSCLWGWGICGAGGPVALTAAVRSTSLRLLRMKQASPLSILQSTGLSAAWALPQPVWAVGCGQRLGGEGRVETPPC